MSKKNTTVYGCLNPQRIRNIYTGKQVIASCRKCAYCTTARSAELTARIEREMNDCFANRFTCLMVTLDYDNEHLPIYENKGFLWYSNRQNDELQKYMPIQSVDVDAYYQPVKHKSPKCFGHLCYPDVVAWLSNVRANLHNDFSKKRRKSQVDELFGKDAIYEDVKFRYFLCGEYGPTTFRPHYHLLIWFKKRYYIDQCEFIGQIFHSCWKMGTVHIQNVIDGGAKSYLTTYLTGSIGLPEVYRAKSLRPFCTFSSSPTIGTIKVDYEEIRQILTDGTHSRTEFDKDTGERVACVLPSSFYRRYFPKCKGFNGEDVVRPTRVYKYVARYFRSLGIVHTRENIDNVCLSDIETWPWDDDIQDEWSYPDKYASLTAYKYSIALDIPIDDVIQGIKNIYFQLEMKKLRDFYTKQEEEFHNTPYNSIYMINHDRFFLEDLPSERSLLFPWQVSALASYGIDINHLYDDEALVLEHLLSYHYNADPVYIQHTQEYDYKRAKCIKRKKDNPYKDSLDNNFVVNK